MIEHAVSFALKHPPNSPEERDFLEDIRALKDLPGVQNFWVKRRMRSTGPFPFQISMWFENQEALEVYGASKVHVDFVNERWIPEVVEQQTLDFVEI